MLPRWLWLDFVESPFVVTREQRQEIRRIARRLAARSPPRRPAMPDVKERSWRRLVRPVEKWPGIVDLCLGIYAITLLANVLCIPASLRSVVVVSVQLLLWVPVTALSHQIWKPWYRLAMHEMGLPICAACGYDLSGTALESHAARTCPECGCIGKPARPSGEETVTPTWSQNHRRAMREIGVDTCRRCGAIVNRNEASCPACGSPAFETLSE